MKQETQDTLVEVAKAIPALAVAKWTLNDWLIVFSILYIFLQAAYLIRKWIREESEWGVKLKRAMDRLRTRPGETSPGDLE